MRNYLLYNVCFILLGINTSSGQSKTNSLKDDAYLHPIDIITPYTLKKGEWIYAQSIQTVPFPSWAFVGVTDKLTAQIDLLPWIYGLFSEFKKPIPSLNFRYQLAKQDGIRPTIAVETMFVHFWDTLERFDTPKMRMYQNGSYFHFKPVIAYQLGSKWNINASLGVDYVDEVIMHKKVVDKPLSRTIAKSWNPNYAIGLDYRPSNWISYHVGYSYGSTLTYLENIPRKRQLTYGFRVAPFYKNKRKFLRNLRLELVAINSYFSDISTSQSFPIPLFPYVYWQW